MTGDPFACSELGCHFLTAGDLARCERTHCPHAWQRRGREDRQAREEADRNAHAEKREKPEMTNGNEGEGATLPLPTRSGR